MNKDRLFNYYWGVVLAITPLYLTLGSSFNTRAPKDYFFMVCAMLSVLCFGLKNVSSKITFPLVAIVLTSFVVSNNFQSAFYLYRLIMIFCGAALGLQVYERANAQDAHIILNALGLTCLIQALICIGNVFDFNYYASAIKLLGWNLTVKKVASPLGVSGTLGNPNIAGALLAITAPALLRRKWFYFLPIAFYAIYLTASTAPVLSLIAALIWLGINNKKFTRYLPFGFMGLSIATPFFIENIRTINWDLALGRLKASTFIQGNGLDSWSLFVKQNSPTHEVMIQMHNEYLEVFYALGLIGVFSVFFINWNIVRAKHFDAITVAGLTNCFFNFTMHTSSTAIVLLVAFFYREREENYV